MRFGQTTRYGVLVLLVVLGSALPALAQTPTPDKPFPELENPRRWGPFYIDPSFEIDRIGIDQNVFRARIGQAKPQSDFVVQLGPKLDLQLLIGHRAALTVNDELKGEVFYANPDLNHADNDLKIRFDILIGKVLFTSRVRWATARQRPNSEIDDRTRRDEREVEQTVRVFLGPRTDISASYELGSVRYTDPDSLILLDPDRDGTALLVPYSVALDRDRERTSLDLGWRLSSGTRFFLEAQRTLDDFLAAETGRDTEDRRAYVGVEFRPTAFVTGTIRIGRAQLKNTDPNFPYEPFDGMVSRTKLVYRPSGRARITMEYNRDVLFSAFDDNLYYEQLRRSTLVDWYFGNRLGMQAGVTLTDLDYPQPNTVRRPIGVKRKDRISDVYGGILFRYGTGVSFGVRYGVRSRESNLLFGDDRSPYIFTNLSYKF